MPPNIKDSDLFLEKITTDIFSFQYPDFKILNKKLLEKFYLYQDHENTRKSHLFENRYENIYISSNLIEELKIVLFYSTQCVQKITGKKPKLSGCWFNYMEPGHITLPHSHDDADELYSAVYYVKVPEQSGNLIITKDKQNITIQPKEGMLVLFPPNLVHHVTKNNSAEARLSLGINIGN